MGTKSRTRVARLPLAVALRWSVALSLAVAVLLVAALSLQMSAGADPTLGPKIVRDPAPDQSQTAPAAPALAAQPQLLAPVQTSSS